MSTASNRHLRLVYLAASYLAVLMVFTHTLIGQANVLADYTFGTILAVFVTMTCVFDAAVIGRSWAFGARLPFLLVWPVATPLYVIRSRGWWGCALLLIHMALLIVMAIAYGIIAVLTGLAGR